MTLGNQNAIWLGILLNDHKVNSLSFLKKYKLAQLDIDGWQEAKWEPSDMLELWPTTPKKVDLSFCVDEGVVKFFHRARHALRGPCKLDEIK